MHVFNPLDYPVIFQKPLRLAPSAWTEHIPFGMFLVDLLRPALLVELGTHHGVSYCAFCQAAQFIGLNARFYAVDKWKGDPDTGFYGPEVFEDLRNYHDQLYGNFSRLIKGDFDEALKYFEKESIDLLHIDGCHTYEEIAHDFKSWLPMMSRRGVVLLHDIGVRDGEFGVWRLWEELKNEYPHFEMAHQYGLGLVAVYEGYPNSLNILLEASEEESDRLRRFFRDVGSKWSKVWDHIEMSKRLEEKKNRVISLEEERDNLVVHNEELRGRLLEIISSHGWKMLQRYRDAKIFVKQIFKNRKSMVSSANTEHMTDEGRIFYAVDTDLSKPFTVGKGNVLHIEGWCYHPDQCIKKLEIFADGISHQAANHSLPRPELMQALSKRRAHVENSLNSGFYTDIPFSDLNGGAANSTDVEEKREVALTLKAVLEDGKVYTAALGKVALSSSCSYKQIAEHRPSQGSEPLIAICMTTYNPRLDWLLRQIDSIISQTHTNWVCIISDDGSDTAIYKEIKNIASKDHRFCVYRNRTNLGFYSNFERCLTLVPDQADFIALCDQDDYWYSDKLEVSLAAFRPDTVLVYSDMEIVTENEEKIYDTYWTARSNNYKNLGALLFANTITGAACVFRANLLQILLPFPQYMPDAYHDHWIGAVAITVGKINYVDRPLYAYRQHGDNVIGHFLSKPYRACALLLQFLYWFLPPFSDRRNFNHQHWHESKRFFQYLSYVAFLARVLKMRVHELTKKDERVIDRYTRFDRSAAALLLESMRLLPLTKSTLGYPLKCLKELLAQRIYRRFGYRHKDQIAARLGGEQRDGRAFGSASRISILKYPKEWRESFGALSYIPGKIAPLVLRLSKEMKPRVNLIFSEVKFKYFYGGYNAVFNLALKIDTLGYDTCIIIVDRCNFDLDEWRRKIAVHKGLEDFFDRIEVIYRYDRSIPVVVSPIDCFIATSWWTAHIAHMATEHLGLDKFVYLIQEFEPIFYPGGTYYALALQSYTFPHYALYSTEFLREYAKENRIGVFADSLLEGKKHSTSFRNAIAAHPPSIAQLSQRKRRKLLFYARPEEHARRNAFELGVLALRESIREGLFNRDTWEFHGIGALSLSPDIPLAGGIYLKMLPKMNPGDFYEFVTGYDIGLSVMISPHPSLMPLDLAASGVLTVTNTYANKTEEKLKAISGNIIPVAPTLAGIKAGLREAVNRVDDVERRISDARLDWAGCWDEAYNDGVLHKLKSWVDAIRISGEKRR